MPEFDKESDVNLPGGSHNLRNYWVRGPGAAKIRWGTDGSFDRCVRQLGEHVKNPQGLCAEYHKAATGEWPAEKGVESSMDGMVEAHGTHNQQDHDPTKGKGDLDKLKSLVGKKPGDVKVPKSKDGLTSEKIRGTKVKEPLDDRRSNDYEDDEDTRGTVGGDIDYGDDEQDRDINPQDYEDEDLSPDDLERKIQRGAAKRERHDSLYRRQQRGDKLSDAEMKELRDLRSAIEKGNVDDDDVKFPESVLKFDAAKYSRAVRRITKLKNKDKLTAEERVEKTRLQKYIDSVDSLEDDDQDNMFDPGFALNIEAGKKRKKRDDDDNDDDMDTYATGDGDEPWNGVLTVEGLESGDGRLFALGSLDWEQPPQPLMYQPANVGGHNGSVMVGNITKITRHGSRIRGAGTVFGSALNSEHGENIRHMVKNGGVSVDVDKVKDADVEMVYADDESGDGGNMFAKPETTIFHRGRIRGATLVAFPAFVEAKLAFTSDALTASADLESCDCDTDDPLVASVHTITIPNLPKAEWFNEPTDVKLSGALTITDEGRVYGILAPGNTNHRDRKVRVPRGNVDYSRFHKGETIVEGGGRVVTGVITASCGHAPTQGYGTLQNRIQHYDNSCSVLANVRVGESRQGHIWFAGGLNPGADPRQVAQALGCALSGDWQPHPDRPGVREFIAAHLVPVPGFPLARTQASVTYEDGMITASAVPVIRGTGEYSSTDATIAAAFNAVYSAKRMLTESLGLDPVSRKRQLAAELAEV